MEVVSAGFDPKKKDYAEISNWPAALSPFYDIITVGAVDPRPGKFLWTTKNEMTKRWGILLPRAPLDVQYFSLSQNMTWCLQEHVLPVLREANLVAYFFSIPVLPAHFLKQPPPPLICLGGGGGRGVGWAVEDFVVGACRRIEVPQLLRLSVWNGLEADSMATKWKSFDPAYKTMSKSSLVRPSPP